MFDLDQKTALLRAVIARLEVDTQALIASQKATQAGAVHSEAKQESSKDTRAIESGYLARGLAARVEDAQLELSKLRSVRLRAFGEDDRVAVGALVTVEDDDERTRHLLILPAAGGVEVEQRGIRVQVVTPAAPLGAALIGRQRGDAATVRTARGARELEIVGIC